MACPILFLFFFCRFRLIVGWCRARARSPTPGQLAALLLVGMGDAHSVLAGARAVNLASWLGPDNGIVEGWLRQRGLPAGVRTFLGETSRISQLMRRVTSPSSDAYRVLMVLAIRYHAIRFHVFRCTASLAI